MLKGYRKEDFLRDWNSETRSRIDFIRQLLKDSGAEGIVYGNSGGKDSALVGILCRAATENTTGLILPCGTSQNYGQDRDDALAVAAQFGIQTLTVDLTAAKNELVKDCKKSFALSSAAENNIAPRLRMTALYAYALEHGCLVAGTGNRSESYMGYFTKWGDGAYDFNVIADFTVTEILDYLRFLGGPHSILEKAPSAGLYEGQTDENEMGITYADIDTFIMSGKTDAKAKKLIENAHERSEHKRRMPVSYKDNI